MASLTSSMIGQIWSFHFQHRHNRRRCTNRRHRFRSPIGEDSLLRPVWCTLKRRDNVCISQSAARHMPPRTNESTEHLDDLFREVLQASQLSCEYGLRLGAPGLAGLVHQHCGTGNDKSFSAAAQRNDNGGNEDQFFVRKVMIESRFPSMISLASIYFTRSMRCKTSAE